MKALFSLASLLLICGTLSMCQPYDTGTAAAGRVLGNDAEADKLLRIAQHNFKLGRYSDAISPLKKLVRQHRLASSAPLGRMMLGEAYEKTGMPRDAFKQYERLVTDYQHSSLYDKALTRQLAMAHAAATGQMKTKVLWLWDANIETSTVEKWLLSIMKNAPYNEMGATSASVLARFQLKNERFDHARMTYAKIVELYPNSSHAPEAQLMVAKLWAQDRARGNRNLVNLKHAEDAYEELAIRYPNHKYAKSALAKASQMRSLMVEQDLNVGRFYMDRAKEYQAAIFCFQDVIRQKALNPKAAAEAAKLIPEAKRLLAAQQAMKKSGLGIFNEIF